MPLPDDPPGRVIQQIQVLRELRGGHHGTAVLAAGLSPMEAMVASGTGMMGPYGWAEPYPDPESLRDRYATALATTERLVAPAYEGLSEADRDRLVELLGGVLASL